MLMILTLQPISDEPNKATMQLPDVYQPSQLATDIYLMKLSNPSSPPYSFYKQIDSVVNLELSVSVVTGASGNSLLQVVVRQLYLGNGLYGDLVTLVAVRLP
jgi:hypothetical protein